MTITSAGQAFWNQRHVLAEMAPRLRNMIAAVDRPTDLTPFQWAEIISFSIEFQPDLILELGRGHGNSTCCFLEAARHIEERGGNCRVVSLCLDGTWQQQTLPRLQTICDEKWFARGNILQKNILEHDYLAELHGARRVLLFWDAHGVEVADWVLSRVMPTIAARPHVVLMHDLSDEQYDGRFFKDYGEGHLWDGECATTNYFRMANIVTSVTQAILAWDFTYRNNVTLHSAGQQLHEVIQQHPDREAEIKRLLGEDMYPICASWFWFSLNEATGALTFPRPRPAAKTHSPNSSGGLSLPRRVLRASRRLAGMIKHKVLRSA